MYIFFNTIIYFPQQSRQRTRSRSVSSPQASSPKSVVQQPIQAVSLTDISAPLHSALPAQETLNKRPTIVENIGQTVSSTNTSVLPQNAVLAQLLSSSEFINCCMTVEYILRI